MYKIASGILWEIEAEPTDCDPVRGDVVVGYTKVKFYLDENGNVEKYQIKGKDPVFRGVVPAQ